MKFKVGDKVRVREDLEINKMYGNYGFIKEMAHLKGEITTIKEVLKRGYRIEEYCYTWTDEMLEKVKKEKETQEKTFREVIADIKEGEVWECGHILITKSNDGIELKGMSSYSSYFTDDNKIFKLQRKEYTFEEAFKAYEKGKEIESCYSQYKYKKEGGLDLYSKTENEWYGEDSFEIDEVRGKWYINN